MKTNGLLIIFIIFILSVFSCKKNDELSHYPINSDLKSAFNYLPGTYWIYRDSISGEIDSFAVRNNVFSTDVVAGNYAIDEIGINITQYRSSSVTDTSTWLVSLSINSIGLTWYKNFYMGVYYFKLTPSFMYPFNVGIIQNEFGQTLTDSGFLSQVYSSYNLNNKVYSNVAMVNHISENSYSLNLYVNPEFGFIKMRIYDAYDTVNKVFELTASSIKR